MNTGLGVRRTAYIIWGALFLGVLMFAAIAAFVGPGLRRGGSHGPYVLADVALAVAVVCLLASRLVPPRMKPPSGADPEAFALSRNIVAQALGEGAGLLGIIAWMLTGRELAFVAVAIAIAGMLACFPGDARWRTLVGGSGPRDRAGPSRMVR